MFGMIRQIDDVHLGYEAWRDRIGRDQERQVDGKRWRAQRN